MKRLVEARPSSPPQCDRNIDPLCPKLCVAAQVIREFGTLIEILANECGFNAGFGVSIMFMYFAMKVTEGFLTAVSC